MSETPQPRPEPAPDRLWRDALGVQLRRMRADRGEGLQETARRAGISAQYLSEVERGRKDASSEMVSAILGALDSSLADALSRVSRDLQRTEGRVIDIRSARAGRGAGSATARPSGPTVSLSLRLAA